VSYAARNEQLAGPALEYLLTAVKTRGPDSRLLMADVVQSMVIIARDHPRATRSPAVIALLQSVLDDMLSHKNVDTLIVPLCIVARASAAALPMPLTNALRARVHDTQVPANARGLALIALSHLAVADPQLLDQAMRRALVDLLPYAAPEPERSIKLLWLQALEVTAELAAAGQLDPEFVQIALRSIGPKRLGLAGTFLPFWGDSAFDMNLQRLVDAGGRVEGQTIDEIVSAIVDTDAIGLEFLAADTLIVAAKAAPPEVQARRTKFEKLYRNRGPSTGEFKRDVRRRILAALGRTDAALGGSRERSQRCKNLLAKESSAEMWQRGTYCVFYDALDHPETLVQWRTYLNGMLDQGVGERMAARMTLEMLAVVPGVVEARNNPAVAPLTRARLRYDLGNREPHISIAARAALLALADHP
jgi:hypothetical protein